MILNFIMGFVFGLNICADNIADSGMAHGSGKEREVNNNIKQIKYQNIMTTKQNRVRQINRSYSAPKRN